MVDMRPTITPKSDQQNYDDFIGVSKTFTITEVRAVGSSQDQPISIFLDGEKRPYKPCKSMRRVMVMAWGGDGKSYVGKRLTLFGDPSVKWAGKEVGGIRISHVSDIDKSEMSIPLTMSKNNRKPYRVERLDGTGEPSGPPADLKIDQHMSDLKEASERGSSVLRIAVEKVRSDSIEAFRYIKANSLDDLIASARVVDDKLASQNNDVDEIFPGDR